MAKRTSAVRNVDHPIVASMHVTEQTAALGRLLKKPPAHSVIIEWAPGLAEHILTNLNIKNRPPTPNKIRRYAADLQAGLWGLTGDTVKFGTDGLLKDGQNRLAAVVRAGGPALVSHTVFGIDPELFSRLDIGKNRTGADIFAIAGVRFASFAAPTTRWLLILTSEAPENRGASYTNEELLRAHRERFGPGAVEASIIHAMDVKKTTGQPVAPLAALHYIFAERDQDKADAFFAEWAVENPKRGAQTTILRERLTEIMASSNNRIHETVRNALIVKVWNAYRAGKAVKKSELKWATGDPFPKIEGRNGRTKILTAGMAVPT